jgi:hypothetical protein
VTGHFENLTTKLNWLVRKSEMLSSHENDYEYYRQLGSKIMHSRRQLPTARGGGFEYLHSSPASHRRRRKGNPVPGAKTGPPCSWGI